MNYDVIVIGAGVIGCSVAMELSKYQLRALVIEAKEDVCTGTSKANSAIVHAGFDAMPGSLMARFNVEGSQRMKFLCKELDVPYQRCGSLVLCFRQEDRPQLEELKQRGIANGLTDLRIVEQAELQHMEPNVSKEALCALYAPSGAIVCPFELTIAMAENACRNGVQFLFDSPVTGITKKDDLWQVHCNDTVISAPVVINAAGVYSAELHNLVSTEKLKMLPRKGEYCLLDKKVGKLVSHTIFQLPTAAGKGILVTPTTHGNILIGPTSTEEENLEGTCTSAEGLADVMAIAKRSVPSIPGNKTITSFAGLRAHLDRPDHDFVIGEARGAENFLDAVGIESPGLSAAPAIGYFLAESAAYLVQAPVNKQYKSGREEVYRPNQMELEERQEFLADHPQYANIICRCEQISEGEIVDAIHRVPGARSLDGIKRRVRAGMGRCQGGFCSPRIMEILSRELGVPMESLTKSGGAAKLVIGHTGKEMDTL